MGSTFQEYLPEEVAFRPLWRLTPQQVLAACKTGEAGHEGLRHMRLLLEDEGYCTCQLNRQRLLMLAARSLAGARWACLGENAATSRHVMPAYKRAPNDDIQAATPSGLWPRQFTATAATQTVPSTTTSDERPFDHDRQAAKLKLANVNGTPFCEVCEQHAREMASLMPEPA